MGFSLEDVCSIVHVAGTVTAVYTTAHFALFQTFCLHYELFPVQIDIQYKSPVKHTDDIGSHSPDAMNFNLFTLL